MIDLKFIGRGSQTAHQSLNLTSFYFDMNDTLFIFECNTDTFRFMVNNEDSTIKKFSDIVIFCTTPNEISVSGLMALIQYLEDIGYRGRVKVFANPYYIKLFESMMPWYTPRYGKGFFRSVFELIASGVRVGFDFELKPMNEDITTLDPYSKFILKLPHTQRNGSTYSNTPIQLGLIENDGKFNYLLSYTGANSIDFTNPIVEQEIDKEFFDSASIVVSMDIFEKTNPDYFFSSIIRACDREVLAKMELVGIKTPLEYKKYIEGFKDVFKVDSH